MSSTIIDAIIGGLKGEHIHSDPLNIIKDLTPTIARKKAPGYDHSCWDLLYHAVIWNDIFLNNIKGLEQNWRPEDNWPDTKEVEKDENFYTLVQRFKDNLQEVRELLANPNLDFKNTQKIIPQETIELSIVKLFITILQHISYHIGQIACVKKIVTR